MEQDTSKYRSTTLKYAFAGLLLFMAACGFVLSYFSNTVDLEISYNFSALALTIAAVALLCQAVKADASRLEEI